MMKSENQKTKEENKRKRKEQIKNCRHEFGEPMFKPGRLMEYVFDPSTKNDDKRITITVSELKRAIKNMQGSVTIFIQQTTHKNV